MRSEMYAVLLACQITCWPTQASESGDAVWGKPVLGCRLGVRADRESYETGQRVILDITLDNSGKQPVHLESRGIFKDYSVDVRLPNGKPAPLTFAGQVAVAHPVPSPSVNRIEAADSRTDVLVLSDYFDMSVAGEYTVSVQGSIRSDDEKDARLIQSSEMTCVLRRFVLSPED